MREYFLLHYCVVAILFFIRPSPLSSLAPFFPSYLNPLVSSTRTASATSAPVPSPTHAAHSRTEGWEAGVEDGMEGGRVSDEAEGEEGEEEEEV